MIANIMKAQGVSPFVAEKIKEAEIKKILSEEGLGRSRAIEKAAAEIIRNIKRIK